MKALVENRVVHSDFRRQRAQRLKNTLSLVPALHSITESVSLRRLVNLARVAFGAWPDWKQSVQSAKGRPCFQ